MKKTINQVFLFIILIALGIVIPAWVFNHVNPWLGIGLGLLVVYLMALKIFKQ